MMTDDFESERMWQGLTQEDIEEMINDDSRRSKTKT